MGQNTCWVVFNQLLGSMFNPTFWAVTQPLGQNNPTAGFVLILPSTGLYLTQHFLECSSDIWAICVQVPNFKNTTLPPSEQVTAQEIERYFRQELIYERNARMGRRVRALLAEHPHKTFFFAFGAGQTPRDASFEVSFHLHFLRGFVFLWG